MKKPDKVKIRKNISKIDRKTYISPFTHGQYSWSEVEEMFFEFCSFHEITVTDANIKFLKDNIYLHFESDDGYPYTEFLYEKALTTEEIDAKVEEIYESEMKRYKKYLQDQKQSRLDKIKQEKAMYEKLKKKFGGSR